MRLQGAEALLLGASECGASSQPVEIRALAASLKCDVDLIFEHVYNNIEYEPLFGSNKGALGTLLDQRGNDIDQVNLFKALLDAAGYSSSRINLQYGYIRVNGTTASSWLGVTNDGNAILQLLANGGIPTRNFSKNGDGTLASLDVAHVWAQVQIAGTFYVFDPSFKLHSASTGIANLASALGYSQSALLSSAGGTIDSVSISNVNRTDLRNTLTSYAGNLIAYIKSNNPGWSVNEVIGGKTIQYLTGSPLRQATLPNIAPSQPSGFPQNWGASVPDAYRTCFTVSMPGVTQTSCAAPSSQTIKLFADETYGRRITIFSTGAGCAPPSGSCTPSLLIEGALPPNGQNMGTAGNYGSSWTVNVAITHPYTGSLATAANQSKGLEIRAGGSYLLSASWGGSVDRGMIEKHRKLLADARAGGAADSSEPVLGESLALISYNWLVQKGLVLQLTSRLGKLTTQYHHGVGISGQAAIQQSAVQGPYVDLPLNSITSQPYTYSSSLTARQVGAFFAQSGLSSSLESAVLEQTQALVAGMQAASTIRLVDLNAAASEKTYFADGTSNAGCKAYYSSIRPNLTGSYAAADIVFIDAAVSNNGSTCSGAPTGKQLLLPKNGSISVGAWQGAGYTVTTQTSTSLSSLQKISGGLSGGFSGTNVSIPALVQSTGTQLRPQPERRAFRR